MKKIKFLTSLFTIVLMLAAAVVLSPQALAYRGIKVSFDPSKYQNKSLGGNCYAYKFSGKWGMYDRYYKRIITFPVYDDIESLDGYYYKVKQNGKWGIIDDDGDIVLSVNWDSINTLSTYSYEISRNGLYGWYSKSSGRVVQTPVYNSVSEINYDLFCVCKDSGCGIARSKDGEILKPLKYQGVFESVNDGYFVFSQYGKRSVIDIFDTVITRRPYTQIKSYDENSIIVKENDSLGLVRMRDGKELAPCIYDKIQSMSQPGFYKVKKDKKWGAVDFDGNLVFNCEYGPLEINRLVKKYPDNQKFKDTCDYNYYYSQYLKAYYYLEYLNLNGVDARSALKKVLSAQNKSQELKDKAEELINTYKVDRSKL